MAYTFDAKQNNAMSWYKVMDGFSKEELDMIENRVVLLPYHRATTEGGPDGDRISNIKWIPQNEEWEWLYRRLMYFAELANDESWGFDLKSAPETIQYTEYDSRELGKYEWHQDIGPNDLSARKISITVQLSDNDEYEGGDLCFWHGGDSLDKNYDVADKRKGNVIIFPSYLVHTVKPVTKGIRKSFVLWLGGGHYK